MKRRVVFAIIILTMMLTVSNVYASDNGGLVQKASDKLLKQQMEDLNVDELLKQIQSVNNDEDNMLPKINFKEYVLALVKGESVLNSKEILRGIVDMLLREIKNNLSLLVKLLALSIICSVLTNLRSAFSNDSVSEIAFLSCYIIIVALVISSCIDGIRIGKEAIDDMVVFMQVLFPAMMVLLAAMGGISSSAIFQPLVLGTMTSVSTIIKDVIIPLIYFSSVIALINNITNKIQISKLAKFMKQFSVVIIGVCFTIFLGIISIQGFTAAQVDGVTIRTAKFAIDSFIPIVGGYLSDAVDTVIGCSMLLKNAVGVIGLIALFVICMVPCIKIFALVFVYKLTAALVQPIADEKLVDSISEISNSFVLVLAAVISVALMFFITITIIITAGKMTVMLR